jgi:predicted nucleic acid-binding protein
MIGENDLWTASEALQDGSVLVTDKTGEFSPVPDVEVETWLRGEAA